MSNQESLLQQPALGKLAQRLLSLSVLSISVASIVLVVLYVAPNGMLPAPALMAEASAEIASGAQRSSVGNSASREASHGQSPTAHDPAVLEHEALDPVGAGQQRAP